MQDELINALRFRRAQIHARWADLLRADRATTPLANPDALVHLLEWTLDEIFRSLIHPAARRRPHRRSLEAKPECPCGRNPLLMYFEAGEQALQEGLILAQASTPGLDALERDASLEELNGVMRHIARREIEAFCGVCQYRREAENAACPHAAAAVAHPPPPNVHPVHG